jgi:hypothetical protein
MPYITREDGERFIIPSYRDTLSAKKPSLLKKEITLLSTNYGEYITLQKKTGSSYEIAFSPDPGYLLGECVWQYFKRPYDMIYCEAIPNTTDAILVIVKSGSVYLDGSFPIDSIPEELVIFKTQQNNFTIYVQGDVPISEKPEAGKFSFDASSIRAFNELDAPLFPKLPGVKAFQLQLVDAVLKSHGIGVMPTKQIVMALVVLGVMYMGYSYLSMHKKELPVSFVTASNPYQGYIDALTTPDPSKELHNVFNGVTIFLTIPGWEPQTIEYTPGFPAKLRAMLISDGARTQILEDWGLRNNVKIDILPEGVFATMLLITTKRDSPSTINPIQQVFATILDRMSYILPGNSVGLGPIIDKKIYQEGTVTISFTQLPPLTIGLLGQFMEGLPLIINKVSMKDDNGELSGTISIKVLGN